MALTLDAFATPKKGPPCGVGVLLSTLDAKDLAVLEAVLADPAVQHARISAVLREEGHKVGDGAVTRHRKGLCACGG